MKDWKGVWIATITPYRNDKIDVDGLNRLIDRWLNDGLTGFCPCGTTGEGWSLSDEEFSKVVEIFLKRTNGKVALVPGTGTNDTRSTIERTKLAKKLGAHGALVVTPYYVKPMHDGLIRHYESIVSATDFPLMIYNVPGRTAVNMMPQTVEKLASDKRIAAIKECAALPQVADLIRRVGGKMAIFSGEDGQFLPFLGVGGVGIVSVAANIAGLEMVSIYTKFMSGKMKEAQKEFIELTPLIESLFVESNPIPVKHALSKLMGISAEARSPLSLLTKENAARLEKEIARLEK